MKELQINPSGLLGLVMKIDKELCDGKTEEEILAQYPVHKTVLPYLLTLVRETSVLILDLTKEYGEVESKYLALKEQIKRLENKKGGSIGVDSQELQKELKTLKNENFELNKELEDLRKRVLSLKSENDLLREEKDSLEDKIFRLEEELSMYENFFSSNSLCAMFYKNFLRKYSQGK